LIETKTGVSAKTNCARDLVRPEVLKVADAAQRVQADDPTVRHLKAVVMKEESAGEESVAEKLTPAMLWLAS